jgi:hypothetical protein
MSNLLNETEGVMSHHGYTPAQVAWVGSADGTYATDWATFARLADRVYDSGYGSQEVSSDLVVVFDDGAWLERGEYDGSEWWSFRRPIPTSIREGATAVESVFIDGRYWVSRGEGMRNHLNETEEES